MGGRFGQECCSLHVKELVVSQRCSLSHGEREGGGDDAGNEKQNKAVKISGEEEGRELERDAGFRTRDLKCKM